VRSQAEKLLQQLTQSLVNLRQKLESGDTSDLAATPVNIQVKTESPTTLNPGATGSQLPLSDQVRQEVSIAWKFVREQLVPVVLSFLLEWSKKLIPL
jgi:hypothetical protein